MNEEVMHRGQTVIALQKQLNLLDTVPVGECVLRRDNTVLFWNACLENWTTLSRAQIIGRKIDRYFPHLNQLRYARRLQETFDGGFTVIFSSQIHPHLIPCYDARGELRVQHTIVTAIPAANGIGFDALLSIQDVTELTQQIQSYKQIQERAWMEIKHRQETEEQLRHDRELLKLRYDQERLVDQIGQQMRQSLNLREILQTTVTQIQTLLQTDRVLIYRLASANGGGKILAEACHPDFPSVMKWMRQNPLLEQQQQEYFFDTHKHPAIQSIADINQADCNSDYVQFLQSLAVRSRLAIPIMIGENDIASTPESGGRHTLWGWLILHQCQSPRTWQSEEIDLLKRLESQLAVSVCQSELLQQVHHLNINLERQVHARTLELQQALTLESTLKRITDKVRDSLDEEQILQSVVKELGEALEVYHCDTTLYGSSQDTFSIQQQYTHPDAQPIASYDYQHHLHIEELFDVYDQLFRGQHFAFCQLQWHESNHHSAILCCPIRDDQGVLGDLWLFRTSASSFSDLEIRLVQQVANQCAIGIRQAQLYKASQQKIEELARLNHLKDDFLSTISHELRTPLVSIRMALQTLDVLLNYSDYPQNSFENHSSNNGSNPIDSKLIQASQYFQLLETECQRETKLIDDLLNLTRLEGGAEPIVCVPIHLESWLPYIAENFAGRMQQQQQFLNLEITPHLPPLITDITILERILTELLNNAYKYTPAGETITVLAEVIPMQVSHPMSWQEEQVSSVSMTSHLALRLAKPEVADVKQHQKNTIRISIRNSGIEISALELNRIFDKFYRIPDNDPWGHGGTGLGLALVKQMVEYLGGSIQVESKSNMTQFTLELAIDP